MNNLRKLNDVGEILDALNETRNCLKAFSKMLAIVLHYDSRSLQADSFGALRLMDRQLDDLEEIENDLLDYIKSTSKDQREPASDPADRRELQQTLLGRVSAAELSKISNALGLDDDTVYKVIMMAAIPGIGPQGRNQNVGEIAKDLNLKSATVERVIDRLMEPQTPASAADGDEAANG